MLCLNLFKPIICSDYKCLTFRYNSTVRTTANWIGYIQREIEMDVYPKQSS